MGVLDKLNEENDSEIIEEFLNQWDIIIDDIDLIIERLNNDYENSINELFRIFHSLKSATAFLKLKRINVFAKLVEDVLESARKKDKVTDELVDWLFLASSQLGKWYDEIMKNENLSSINPKILNIPKGY
jgi:two-component system chemotaxis sensor kinase CheA